MKFLTEVSFRDGPATEPDGFVLVAGVDRVRAARDQRPLDSLVDTILGLA